MTEEEKKLLKDIEQAASNVDSPGRKKDMG